MFFTHGASKVFGWFGGNAFSLTSQMGIVGLAELIGGLAIALGLYTRLAALGCLLLGIIIYFKAHVPKGILPMSNGGELILLYIVGFLFILGYGAPRGSLERKLTGKEKF